MHEHTIDFGDFIERSGADRGVPGRDREREEALAGLRNGEPKVGDLIACHVHMTHPDRKPGSVSARGTSESRLVRS